jgi:hypothetical protein
MKIGVIIPDRNDRPKFLANCLRMMEAQTLKPKYVRIIDYPAINEHVDITPRYRTGYLYMSAMDVDLIAFIENDDYYAPDYFETMVEAWKRFHKPSLFGTCYTIYYHLQLKRYFTMEHHQRASAMNTFIKPALNIKWPVDMEPFLDMHLWSGQSGITGDMSRVVFKPEKIISVGMKHAVGKTIGGGNHVIDERVARRYATKDVNDEYPQGFLKTVLDPESFNFYNNYFQP